MEIETAQPFSAGFGGDLLLRWDGECLHLTRKNRRTGLPEVRVWHGQLRKLNVLCDSSSLEIFINDGEAVMTSRYFPVLPALVNFGGDQQITLRHWLFADCVLE
ncbi:GH32 C-terminal domain-containing protein [Rahnella sp. PCH160]|uniref:GH32 C-terminal domain-containing protein n=1 Tax=Rahnella sp. PCH160 TaxID=3447928 RepID=UPI0039FCB2CF